MGARKWPVAALVILLLTACGQAAPSPSLPSSAGAAGPAPAPTDAPTQTPQPTATSVPTDTPVPTATPVPDTPTPVPTNTPRPTSTPEPGYPSNVYERTAALKSYHFQITVKAAPNEYSVTGDEVTPSYHVSVNGPILPPADVYFVNGHYIWSSAGTPFLDTGANPPPQAAILEGLESFAKAWLDKPDSAVFKGTDTANGVRAHHFVLTWKAGRQIGIGGLSASTYDPTTGDIWLEATSGAPVKANFSMRIANGGEVSTIVTEYDVTKIGQVAAIAAPRAVASA